jgi:CheY-like chemotaxis protein
MSKEGQTGVHVLLVDDNQDDRLLAKRELEREFPDLVTTEVSNRTSLYEALEKGQFTLAVVDYQLKWSDGLSVTRAIKARYPDRPVIMFTNSGDEEIAVKALKQGVDDYVLKRKGYQSLATSAKNRLSLSETSTRVPRCLLVCEAEKERDFFKALIRRFNERAYIVSYPQLEEAVESLLSSGDIAFDAFVWAVKNNNSAETAGPLSDALKKFPLLPVLVINGGRPGYYFELGAWAVAAKPIEESVFVGWLSKAITVSMLTRTVKRQNEALERYARILEDRNG